MPAVVEALQFADYNFDEMEVFTGYAKGRISSGGHLTLYHGDIGYFVLNDKDWVVKDDHGYFYGVKREEFEATYEAVDGQ